VEAGDRVSYDDGYRDSPAFRDSAAYRESVGKHADEQRSFLPGSYPVGEYPANEYPANEYGTETTLGLREQEYETLPPAPTQDPAATPARRPAPARDRVGVHFAWELVLLLAAGAVGFLLWRADRNVLRGDGLEALYIQVAIVGAVTVASALSLRAAVPNLALGPIVFAAAMFFAENSGRGVVVTAGVTALLAAAAGVAVAIVVTAFHVPAWAASLGAGLGLIVWIQDHRAAEAVVGGAYDPRDHAVFFFGGFVALSVLGGVLGMIGGLRRATGRYRPAGDPSVRGGGAVPAALALITSSVFAAAAGVLLALNNREVAPTENGIGLTVLALGAALLGGTSIYGRRGGLFGTALAVAGLVLLSHYLAAENRGVSVFALAAGALGVGLLVSRLVEALGRPKVAPEPAAAPAPAEVEYEAPPLEIPHDVTHAGQRPWEPEDAPRPAERWDERWASH
jgi:ribose/xylose/arabinose/galactoside ABC-type transport system permease subunit